MKYMLLFLCVFFTISMSAQEPHKRTYSPTLPAFVRMGDTSGHTYFFPEFYSRLPKHSKDTTWKFECYDSRDSIMDIDTVGNISEVRFFSVFKSYTDSAHTYKDSNGVKQLLPVSSIIQRYDKVGKDKWLSVDYSRNKYTELKEFPKEIVKIDTLIISDQFTGKEQSKYYKYYKVTTMK